MADVGAHMHGGLLTGHDIAFRVRKDLLARRVASSAASLAGQPAVQVKKQPSAAAPRTIASIAPAVASHAAPAAMRAAAAAKPQAGSVRSTAKAYIITALLMTAIGVATIWNSNRLYAPEMYDDEGMLPVAQAFAAGKNYATFDLNINIRKLRDLHVAEMTHTPEVVTFGASQWQEAHKELLPGIDFYNSHIHRDYWQDMFAVTDIWVRHNRLPKKVIIAMRDKLFTPMELRKDYLWEPGIPYWRSMADRLGIPKEPVWQSLPYQRLRERFSLAMLFNNLTRWYNADERPHASGEKYFEKLDTLLPDGSILWSKEHMKIFTPERSRAEALAFAKVQSNSPPVIEQAGVENFEKLLDYLKSQGVTVYFVQPPFNPIYWDAVQNTSYMDGLMKFDALTREMAKRHGIKMIGGFDPRKVGCDETQYIDAEHSNPSCLKHIFNEFMTVDKAGSL